MTFAKKLMTAVFVAGLALGGVAATQMMTPDAMAQAGAAKQIVDNAKAQGLVGETIDGYLELVSGTASDDVQAAVKEINIRRKSVYTQLARDKNTSPDAVAAVSGEKLVAKAKPGEKVKLADGKWHSAN